MEATRESRSRTICPWCYRTVQYVRQFCELWLPKIDVPTMLVATGMHPRAKTPANSSLFMDHNAETRIAVKTKRGCISAHTDQDGRCDSRAVWK